MEGYSKPITYKSTRGAQSNMRFEEVVLEGLATDGGLFVPECIPTFTIQEIEDMRGLSYVNLAYIVLSKFISDEDIPTMKLKEIVRKSFETFRSKDVTPSIKLSNYWVLELFHGPTFAFKDVALQFLGNLFEYFLENGNIQKSLTILGATSGDTGSAAIYGLRGKKNVNCFMMYPTGKVTEIQEKQMTVVLDSNVHCISLDNANFDDCQNIVKKAFKDVEFNKKVKLGAVNSINWARVLAQITYYFYCYLRVTDNRKDKKHHPHINFVVPTGNFGDILAGYYAKRMGLPVGKLVIATNANDVLHRFMSTGHYTKVDAEPTIAPSMDISISSNFERYLLYLADENPDTLKSWMDVFEKTGELAISKEILKKARDDFDSYASSKDEIVCCMRETYDKDDKYLLCPHTATAAIAVKKLKLPSETTVVLATAHPAKFEEAIDLALTDGREIPKRPKELNDLFGKKTKTNHLPNDDKNVKNFMLSKLYSWSILKPTNLLFGFVTIGTIVAVKLQRDGNLKQFLDLKKIDLKLFDIKKFMKF
jgi:threonine synthase